MAKRLRVKRTSRTAGKRQNSAVGAKVEIRRWLVAQLGGAPAVLDCFCASGVLWELAYDRTEKYLGLDVRPFTDARRTICCDSRRYLRHADAPIASFDLFDLDAYGSPIEHLVLLCMRLRESHVPGRRLGICLTDGTGLAARFNNVPRGLRTFLGMAQHLGAKVNDRYRDDVIRMAVTKALALGGLRVVESRRVEKTSGAMGMRYFALLCERLPTSEA